MIIFILYGSCSYKCCYKNHKSIAECLTDEIINCEKNSLNSYAKKKDEVEKVDIDKKWIKIIYFIIYYRKKKT